MSNSPPVGAPLRVAVILGSNREGRFAPAVANWFVEQVGHRADFDFDLIDLVEFDIPSRLGSAGAAAMAPFRERIGRADAFVVITPESTTATPAR